VAMSPGASSVLPEGREFFPGGSAIRGDYGLSDDAVYGDSGGLAPVERVRQFFPETWVWEPALLTDTAGRATLELIAPDSITNWKLRATSTSEEGVGLAGDDLVVFQDFFVEPDLPYSVIRGEELWLPVAVYNYLDTPQTVLLEMEASGGLLPLGGAALEVEVGANAVKGARFPVRAVEIGTYSFKLTARGSRKADALIRPIRIDPEGVPQQDVENRAIQAGSAATFAGSFPDRAVQGSERILLTITGSQVAQTIRGVEDLCGRPYG
jgi:CD109 antigen